MKKILLLFCCLQSLWAGAQTLFSYGKTAVTKEEFLRAYNKNNTAQSNTEAAYKDYLELYIRFKLKVQAALDAKLDTLPNQQLELYNFRSQVIDNYMNDEIALNALVNEAFERSQKDLHIAYINIPFTGTDTITAFKKATEAQTKLKEGADFATIASQYSADPDAKYNGGDIGFITVFSLPYALETVCYKTKPGTSSAIVKTKAGYYIFKNIEERPAVGKLKAAQILLAFPPDITEAGKLKRKQLADSLYTALQQGASFSELAAKYSNDNIGYLSGGNMPDFGVGKYETAFENAAFSLEKDGAFSKPVASSFGYHIIQRLQKIPVNANGKNETSMALLKQSVQSDKRIEIVKQVLANRILKETGFKQGAVNIKSLAAITDSLQQNKSLKSIPAIVANTVMFSFPRQKVTTTDFAKYLESIQPAPDLWQGKSVGQLIEQYQQAVAMEYYRNNLEQYNKEFAYQIKEFKEGNLLFEIMQKEVWEKAAADSNGLKKYFSDNKTKYLWEKSADAIFFTATDSVMAAETREGFLKNTKSWRLLAQNSDGRVQSDSGRFELTQILVPDISAIATGYCSPIQVSATDNIATFVYIVKVYTEKQPRNYEDARGFVINDYQAYLEEQWINALKKKYPVKVNDAVLTSCWK